MEDIWPGCRSSSPILLPPHLLRQTPFRAARHSARWADGVRHGQTLLGEINAMGYTGSRATFYRLLALWKHRDRPGPNSSSGAQELPSSIPEPIDPATGHLISPIVAAALCIKPRGVLTRRQAVKVAVLKAASDDFVRMQ